MQINDNKILRAKLSGYLLNLNLRKRISIIIMLIICTTYLVYNYLYLPIVSIATINIIQIKEKTQALVFMQHAWNRYHNHHVKKTINNNQLLSMLSAELKPIVAQEFIYHVQQINNNDIQLTFDKVPYNAIINWLWRLNYNYNLLIKELVITRTITNGLVNFNVILNTG